MPRKYKFIIGITLFIGFLIGLIVMAKHNAKEDYQRSIPSLMNQYYQLRKSQPEQAKRALELILRQDPNNQQALAELGYLNQHDIRATVTLGDTDQFNNILALAQSQIDRYAQQAGASLTWPESEPEVAVDTPLNLMQQFAQYYALKPNHTAQAMLILQDILRQEPHSALAYSELGYLYLAQHQPMLALQNFQAAYELSPTIQLAIQIGYLLITQKQLVEAKKYFEQAQHLNGDKPNEQIDLTLSQLNAILNPAAVASVTVNTSGTAYDQLMNNYYALKTTNPQAAWQLLLQVLASYPDDLMALKEAGYYTLAQQDYPAALGYFTHAYQLTGDAALAMQVGYILNIEGKTAGAYQYFVLATKSSNQKIKMQAEGALDNLSGLQTKVLPQPFFMDLYYAPFYFSRFALIVNPLIARAGITFNQAHNAQVYMSVRYTRDNRSSGGEIPQIYESDEGIVALGVSIQPFIKIPLSVFAEAGKAYNLLNVQPRLINDRRAGAAFYTQWGDQPKYTLTSRFPHQLIGSFYSSIIYYSQYNDDIIGDFRLREGLRVLQYKASTVDLYVTGHSVLDTNHEFYNNIFEWGPGIAFTPSTRYNIVFRLEALKGYYLPVNSPSPNPYGPNYRNTVAQLVTYMKF